MIKTNKNKVNIIITHISSIILIIFINKYLKKYD